LPGCQNLLIFAIYFICQGCISDKGIQHGLFQFCKFTQVPAQGFRDVSCPVLIQFIHRQETVVRKVRVILLDHSQDRMPDRFAGDFLRNRELLVLYVTAESIHLNDSV